MYLAKNNLASKIALYHEKAKLWRNPFAGIAVLLGVLLRKKHSSRIEVFLGVSVYFIESRKDLSLAASLLEGSAVLLNAISPFWANQVKKVFKCFIIRDMGPMFHYNQQGNYWEINPLKFRSSRREKQIVILTMNLMTALCLGLLYQGRYGYFGLKNCQSITLRAVARFLRKCNSDGNCSDLLSWCYQRIDKVRPGRDCYERFRFEKNMKGRTVQECVSR